MIVLDGFSTVIHREAMRRFETKQRNGTSNARNLATAYNQEVRGCAAEIAASIQLGINPMDVMYDTIAGRPDLKLGDIPIDVKSITDERPTFSVQYFDGMFEKKQGWKIMVMKHYRKTWNFEFVGFTDYEQIKQLPIRQAAETHRTPFYVINTELMVKQNV